MKLTEHFQLSEFEKTSTGFDNKITEFIVLVRLVHLCINLLEPIRLILGKPVYINSGYRSSSVNAAVGGVSNSDHLYGYAADISSEDYSKLADVVQTIIDNNFTFGESDFNQIIFYPKRKFIHISYRFDGTNKGQVIYK